MFVFVCECVCCRQRQGKMEPEYVGGRRCGGFNEVNGVRGRGGFGETKTEKSFVSDSKMCVRCRWERRGAKKLTVFSWLSFLLYCYTIHSICTVSLPPEISSVLHPHLLLPPRSSIINKLCWKYPPSPRQQRCVWQSLLFFFSPLHSDLVSIQSINLVWFMLLWSMKHQRYFS